MIDLLGLVIFAVIVGIGLLDMRSGLGPFAMYRSPTGPRLAAVDTGDRGDGNQPEKPAPTR